MSKHSRTPSRRLVKFATIAVIPLALLGAGALVSTASYSAFSATTSNQSNTWLMGSVALTNSSPAGAAFNAENLAPGATDTTCIEVTSTGTLPAAVKLYAKNATQTQDLGDFVNLHVTQGTGGGNGTCDGFTPQSSDADIFDDSLTSFITNSTNYSNGVGNWVTTGGSSTPENRTFEITYTVSENAPSSVMGGTAHLDFTWEAQNT